MKIACIAAARVPSDTANSIQVMKACQALAQVGHQVRLLVPGTAAVPWEQLADHYGLQTPFEMRWMPARLNLRRYDFGLACARAARLWGADLAYVWPLQAAVSALAVGLPVALELHGEPEGRFGPWLYRLFLALPGRKRVLPITQALADSLAAANRALPSCVISPNGVDLERYQDLPEPREARRRLGLPERLTAGYTGHLYAGRGIDLLAELARRFPDVTFLWVGGRPADVTAWRERLETAGLVNVALTGFVENHRLPLYQAAADVLLMPYETAIAGSSGGDSAGYASPMKMFEYLASGRAILSSDLPVIREVLDSRVARLCPPEEPDAWAQALSGLLANPEERLKLGEQAREKARQYTWTARAERALAGFPGGEAP